MPERDANSPGSGDGAGGELDAATSRPWRHKLGIIYADIPEGEYPTTAIAYLAEEYRHSGHLPTYRVGAANAELIVRAVNAHDDLVAALNVLLALVRSLAEEDAESGKPWENPVWLTSMDDAAAALAKASPAPIASDQDTEAAADDAPRDADAERLARESKENTHQRFYGAFHDWFMQSGCDFWSECDAPENLASIAVELSATPSKPAAEILAERRRQIEREGWSLTHDDGHADGSLALAAAYYAAPVEIRCQFVVPCGCRSAGECPHETFPKMRWRRAWPFAEPPKRKDRRRDLIRAGALILAEIERLDRALSPAPAASAQDTGAADDR